MAAITLTINDEVVSASDGQTLIEVIQERGIPLPTLCYLEGLSGRGGCRMCMVELGGSPRLFAACVTRAAQGMVVVTNSERLIKYRKMILELLFAERNHVCAVCVMNGHCELQRNAAEIGMDHVRYDYLCPDLPMDATHERFVMDHNRCILCTRCLRVCDEVEGAHTWDLKGRGINSRITSDLNQDWGDSESCTKCGKCVQVCPTGALFKKGTAVGEMEKNRGFLPWILAGRERKEWQW
jgi:bidirectional [NiFe] hydrogenase diaphorase subunit